MSSLLCWNCGENLDALPKPITRHNNCPKCYEALHCCVLCNYYRPDENIACDDERSDPPLNKENANFCEYFRPNFDMYDWRPASQDTARSKLNALFVSKETRASHEGSADETSHSREDQAKEKLGVLFGNDQN